MNRDLEWMCVVFLAKNTSSYLFNVYFWFQIDVFRSIRDDDGNQLTHNFRPIQPLGDRVVFYVPPYSAAVPDLELDGNIPAITEPPQNIDSNAPVKHDKFQGDLEEETPDDIDLDMQKIDQDLNSVEKDTKNHPKNTKKGKNSSSIISISNVTLIMSALIWISMKKLPAQLNQ